STRSAAPMAVAVLLPGTLRKAAKTVPSSARTTCRFPARAMRSSVDGENGEVRNGRESTFARFIRFARNIPGATAHGNRLGPDSNTFVLSFSVRTTDLQYSGFACDMEL